MSRSILPSGEELNVTPDEILRYLNPDGLRQLLRQERLRWNLKTNKDTDYYDNTRLYRYSGEMHNEGNYQRMEIRTFPDNGAYAGYAGINIDSGVFGLVHNVEKWDKALSEDSLQEIVNRVMIGASANVPDKHGYGLNDLGNMTSDTTNRMALMLFDPFDGRAYLLSNDPATYMNNESRKENKLPGRTVARIADIPTRITHLINDLDFVSDPDYHHTDNNFTHSNRYILDNMDDRTFVYPEISKDTDGVYIKNIRIGLAGTPSYGESDGEIRQNTQPDLGVSDITPNGDRNAEAISSYGTGLNYSGVDHLDGYLPGVFRSLDELEKVDLIDQRQTPKTHGATPGARRPNNYYLNDGRWSANWFDRENTPNSYEMDNLDPNNMETDIPGTEPVPFADVYQNEPKFDRSQLYQWRYNRIDIQYLSDDIEIYVLEAGSGYEVGDILKWNFGDDSFDYRVTSVGSNGQIQTGEYVPNIENVYDQDPSTHGVGIEFSNTTGSGSGAKLVIKAKGTVVSHATQIKNNLYAYVDITPSVRSDITSQWADKRLPDTQGGKVGVRSTAAGPAYSGINSGRGGPAPNDNVSGSTLYEHGGNATAGVHVHLFRYVINTENPTWVIRDGIKVYTGRWVDQGPMGIERPCDIKALLFSNPDTNNFNNYYKFMMDTIIDGMNRNPDTVSTNNPNAVCTPLLHIDQVDPTEDRRFTEVKVDPVTSEIVEVDVTSRVIYINAATGVLFVYNGSYKNDPSFGYGFRRPGWFPIAGATSR